MTSGPLSLAMAFILDWRDILRQPIRVSPGCGLGGLTTTEQRTSS